MNDEALFRITCIAMDGDGKPQIVVRKKILSRMRDRIRISQQKFKGVYLYLHTKGYRVLSDAPVSFGPWDADTMKTTFYVMCDYKKSQDLRKNLNDFFGIPTQTAIAIEYLSELAGVQN